MESLSIKPHNKKHLDELASIIYHEKPTDLPELYAPHSFPLTSNEIKPKHSKVMSEILKSVMQQSVLFDDDGEVKSLPPVDQSFNPLQNMPGKPHNSPADAGEVHNHEPKQS